MRFDHVGLNVADLDRMTAWYSEQFGLHVETTGAIEAEQCSIVMLCHPEGFRLELLHRPGGTAGLRADHPLGAVLTYGYGHTAFSVSDLEGRYTALLGAGATSRLEPQSRPGSALRIAFVADPEGNLVELVQRPPTSRDDE